LNRRNDRRQRIQEAFAAFHDAVAAARGGAKRAHDAASVQQAREMFEQDLRSKGIDRALRDPDYADSLTDPRLAAIVAQAKEDWEQAFAKWTNNGPRALIDLVAEAAPGSASEDYENWLGQIGTVDGRGPVPSLWRIGTAVATTSPVPVSFPVAVPLLERSHLAVFTSSGSRPQAENLVESLVLRVLSHFQPGLVHVHVWDVGQLTGSLPGLYPLTRAGLLTVHDPARPAELLDELAEHIRKVHTTVLVGGHDSLRSMESDAGLRTEPWRIAVLFGRPDSLKDEELHKLQRIARNGLAAGVQLVLVDIPITVNSPLETVKLFDDRPWRTTMSGEHATFHMDPVLPREIQPP